MKKAETYFGFSTFYLFGFSLILVSTLIPIIEKSYHIDHSLIGLAFSVGSIAFFFSSIIFGYILEKYNMYYTIIFTLLLFIIGNFFLFSMTGYIHLLLGIFLTNFAGGGLELSIPFLIGLSQEEKKSKTLNLLHSAFALGAVSSPIVSSLILRYTNQWKLPFLIAIILNIVPFILFSLSKHDISKKHTEYLANPHKKESKFIITKTLIILTLSLGIYVAYEMNFTSWLATFLYEYRGFKVSDAAMYPSFLWIGLFLGRTLLSHMPEKYGYKNWLVIAVLMSLIFSTFTVFLGKTLLLSLIGTLLTGIGYATTYPTIQALLIEKFKNNKGFALSFASASTSVISAIGSSSVGYIGKLFGIFFGLLFLIGLNFIEFLLIFRIEKQ
ncbi:fucose permease [Marinitoga piezophila KA3]|uniref:Fucose permease n=1 Tax=Marinitoga piezophila (strain DSM 14283 / JCM 11233 / KA3) TaxID=443254 RepID=H2J754_MARPK|nr:MULTISPECIES: MFS transporter [Marinitoga]AEX86424.1 fucose permease [Marinitoga piezophila KA3]NUU98511.1 MFS transporter [Marinitoga sp. 1138]